MNIVKESIDKINSYSNVNINIISNATHSLEVEDSYIESLNILGFVSTLCEGFVSNKK